MERDTTNYGLQETIYRQMQDRPEWKSYLTDMLEYEDAHQSNVAYIGWEWSDVHCPVSQINMMVAAGLVNVHSKSRTYTFYRLRSQEDTREAIAVEVAPQAAASAVDVEGLFSLVIGHERVKTLLRYALKADGAVHCLLAGPPGTAKTLILSDIGRLEGAQFYLGSTTTRSGLVGLLLSNKPAYLVIDEIDKMEDRDMSPLLSLMETGMVMRLQHGHQERVSMPTRVFAGANDLKKLSQPILNRFARFELPPYTPAQFVEVCRTLLTKREGLGPEMALHVASEVVQNSLDIRDAVRVARMAHGHPTRVVEICRALWPPRGR
jgi:hypothetical protein